MPRSSSCRPRRLYRQTASRLHRGHQTSRRSAADRLDATPAPLRQLLSSGRHALGCCGLRNWRQPDQNCCRQRAAPSDRPCATRHNPLLPRICNGWSITAASVRPCRLPCASHRPTWLRRAGLRASPQSSGGDRRTGARLRPELAARCEALSSRGGRPTARSDRRNRRRPNASRRG